MSNEEKILALLESLQSTMTTQFGEVNKRLDSLDRKMDAVYDQTANLTEFKTEVKADIEDIRAVLKQNTYDIARLKAK